MPLRTYEVELDNGQVYEVDIEERGQPQIPTNAKSDLISQVGTGLTDVAKAIINPVYRASANTLQGLEGLVRRGKMTTYINPLTGDVVEPVKNIKEAAGTAGQVAALIPGVGPGTQGALFASGQALSEDKSLPEVVLRAGGGAIVGKGLEALTQTPEIIQRMKARRAPDVLKRKAEKFTTEILNPPKADLAEYIAQGRQLPAVEQMTPIIKKSRTYGELLTNLRNTIKSSFEERNSILASNNFRVKPTYIKALEDSIIEAKAGGQRTPLEIKQMEDVLTREKVFYTKNRGLDRVKAQARKEYLQKETRKLLEGKNIQEQPARKQALDSLRRGLKEVVEAGDPNIARINSTYEGLSDAKDLLAGQEALSQKALTPGAIEKIFENIPIVRALFRPSDIPTQIAREAARQQSSLFSKTGKIEKFMRKANIPTLARR